MGGEVTVYSGWLGAGLAAGISGISLKLRPGMSNPGIWGICIPLMGGIPPPIRLDISLDIMLLLEELENEEELELENDEEDILDMLEAMLEDIMSIPPPIFMLPIILDIMSSIPRDFMSPIPPIILGIPPMPIPPIMGGIGPPDPDDIIVDDDDEDEDDLKLEIVDPSSDCVVAAIL